MRFLYNPRRRWNLFSRLGPTVSLSSVLDTLHPILPVGLELSLGRVVIRGVTDPGEGIWGTLEFKERDSISKFSSSPLWEESTLTPF